MITKHSAAFWLNVGASVVAGVVLAALAWAWSRGIEVLPWVGAKWDSAATWLTSSHAVPGWGLLLYWLAVLIATATAIILCAAYWESRKAPSSTDRAAHGVDLGPLSEMEEVILRGLAGVDGRPINAELLARIIDKRILALEPALDSLDSRGFLEAD